MFGITSQQPAKESFDEVMELQFCNVFLSVLGQAFYSVNALYLEGFIQTIPMLKEKGEEMSHS